MKIIALCILVLFCLVRVYSDQDVCVASNTYSLKVIMIGIANSNHDHSTAFTIISPYFANHGYTNYIYAPTTLTENAVKTMISSNASVFITRSHGGADSLGTHIKLDDLSTGSQRFYSGSSMNGLNLSAKKLIAFIGCSTAEGTSNLPSVAVNKGAATALGFATTINCDLANQWTEDFFYLLYQGMSVSTAKYYLKNISPYKEKYEYTTLKANNVKVYGSTSTTL